MALFASNLASASTDRALGAAKIQRSLRFYEPNPSDQNSTAATNLTRTPSSTGNQKIWTFSSWIKKFNCIGSGNDSAAYIYSADTEGSGNDYMSLYFQDDEIYTYFDPGNNYGTTGSRKFRDPTSWFHLVHQVDATNTVQKIWINGEELSLNSGRNPGNNNYPMNQSGVPLVLGKASWKGQGFNGYLAEVHLIDGSLIAPTDFGFTDPQTGIWMPKRYEGTHGTNGFYLDFSDNSSTATLGIDKSTNGNDFTANNFSVAAWPDNDSVIDTPTNNFNTFNDNDRNSNVPLANGGLETAATATGGHYPAFTTKAIKSGKWYLEWKFKTNDSGLPSIMEAQHDSGSHNTDSTVGNNTSTVNKRGYGLLPGDGRTSSQSGYASYGSAISSSDTAQCAFDADTGKIYWGKNNTWFNSGNPETGANPAFSGIDMTKEWLFTWHVYGNNNNVSVNFGSQGFTYTPPSGFKSLCTENLSLNETPSAIKPKKHFDVLTYTGTGSSNSITGLEFSPDFIWAKRRDTAGHHHLLIDTIRGGSKSLSTNLQDADNSNANRDMTFLSNGIRWNSDTGNANANGGTYVVWCWKAGGSSSTYNIDGTGYATAAAAGLDGGTIDPTGSSINTEAGFSITTYTGNGTAGATVAHGLGKKPAWIIIKRRDASDNWMVYHKQSNEGSSPEDFYLELNSTGSTNNSTAMLNDNPPSTTLITLGSDNSVNGNTATYVMYCWAEIPGFSKFGEYRARDADNSGPYIHTDFKPAWVMSKGLSLSWQDWCIFDNKRSTSSTSGSNPISGKLGANETIAEANDNYNVVDFLSDGWRVSGLSASDINYGSGYPKQLYMAFAEESSVTPFNTVPNAG